MKTNRSGFGKLLGHLLKVSLFFQLNSVLSVAAVEDQSKALPHQVAQKALFFLPRSLRDVIHRHEESFEKGLTSLSMDPFLSPSGRIELEDRLLERLKLTIQSLDSKPKFSEVANSLGSIAAMVVYLNLPEGVDLTKEDFQLLLDYSVENAVNFPLVVYDRLDENGGPDSWLDSIRTIRVRRVALSERFLMAHPQIRLEKSGEED